MVALTRNKAVKVHLLVQQVNALLKQTRRFMVEGRSLTNDVDSSGSSNRWPQKITSPTVGANLFPYK
jgi:hypothetical protein